MILIIFIAVDKAVLYYKNVHLLLCINDYSINTLTQSCKWSPRNFKILIKLIDIQNFFFILYFHILYWGLSHKNHSENPSLCHSITGNTTVPSLSKFANVGFNLLLSQAIICIDNDFTSLSHRPNLVLDRRWG